MKYQIVDANYVLLHTGEMPIVDVRPQAMYEESRIPTAQSVSMMPIKEEGGDVAAKMAARFAALGIGPDDPVIVYCYNGGLAREACDYLESQGYFQLRCYEGSWVDWIALPTRPIEK